MAHFDHARDEYRWRADWSAVQFDSFINTVDRVLERAKCAYF